MGSNSCAKKLTFRADASTVARIHRLKETTEAASQAEVLRRALIVYERVGSGETTDTLGHALWLLGRTRSGLYGGIADAVDSFVERVTGG